MIELRRWMSVAYVIASLLAVVGHDHHPEQEVAAVEAGCDSAGPHYASHDGPDLSHSQPECPVCQFRTGAQLGPLPSQHAPESPHVESIAGHVRVDLPADSANRLEARGPPAV